MVEWCSFSRIDEMEGGFCYSRFIFRVTRWAFLIGDILQDLLHIEARPVTQDPIVSRT